MNGERIQANLSLDESYAYCKTLTKRTAGNFYYSFFGLSADSFRAMCALYAFMRISDDLGDSTEIPNTERAENLTRWRENFQSALQGDTSHHAVFPAVTDIIRRYQIPEEHFLAVIDGVFMDLKPKEFETFEDLSQYCYHVAGAVGLCCIHIWGFHDERAIDAAVDCGLAFQLTNILRDLGDDAQMGRIYLPQEDLQRFDYTTEDIARHCRDDRFQQLMQFEVSRAKVFYRKAEKLFEYIEPPGKPILRAMLQIYGGLLAKIERHNYDVFTRRVALPTWRKLLIAANAIVGNPLERFR